MPSDDVSEPKKKRRKQSVMRFDVLKWNIKRCGEIYQSLMEINHLKKLINSDTAKLIAEYSIETQLRCLQCADRYSLICPTKWIRQNCVSSDNNAMVYYSKRDEIYIHEKDHSIGWKEDWRYEILCSMCANERGCCQPGCDLLCWWNRACSQCNRSFCAKCMDSYIQTVDSVYHGAKKKWNCVRCECETLWLDEFGELS